MRELRIENHLKDVQGKLVHWASLLNSDKKLSQEGLKNIAQWLEQEANRIQITLELKG